MRREYFRRFLRTFWLCEFILRFFSYMQYRRWKIQYPCWYQERFIYDKLYYKHGRVECYFYLSSLLWWEKIYDPIDFQYKFSDKDIIMLIKYRIKLFFTTNLLSKWYDKVSIRQEIQTLIDSKSDNREIYRLSELFNLVDRWYPSELIRMELNIMNNYFLKRKKK